MSLSAARAKRGREPAATAEPAAVKNIERFIRLRITQRFECFIHAAAVAPRLQHGATRKRIPGEGVAVEYHEIRAKARRENPRASLGMRETRSIVRVHR